MFSKMMLIAPAALSLVAAVPLNKRDVVWVTETDVAVVTVPVTTTLWVNPGESVPTSSATVSHYGHHRSHVTSTVQSTVTIASSSSEESSAEASSTTSTSVYVAPTTTSTSEYVAPTTLTSSYVAPTTTSTSEYVAPTTPTSTWVAPETTSEAPAPSSYAAASSTTVEAAASGTTSSDSAHNTGDITWYAPGMGSCGWTNTEDEAIVAIPHGIMENGANPNLNPLCGQYITISYAGATHQAKIVDTCGGCDGQAIDLTHSLFDTVAPSGDGRVHNVEWWFNGA
ncbi:hypothetical protein LTR56_020325 [Elasticomyces elasticus]|nr:hypothetical protein LTR56_020325 [Elasticomyces elasticus]KAK3655619.1 hypothetical protein LTR22_010209 [Elasticomyces elasticus]KAK4910277.1 hypothetical protein LTR49_021023 [Elasticomyces elasticus]KAK5748515.1 hypothetical protein LTS12_021417 [Elasticomyces elasticus]